LGDSSELIKDLSNQRSEFARDSPFGRPQVKPWIVLPCSLLKGGASFCRLPPPSLPKFQVTPGVKGVFWMSLYVRGDKLRSGQACRRSSPQEFDFDKNACVSRRISTEGLHFHQPKKGGEEKNEHMGKNLSLFLNFLYPLTVPNEIFDKSYNRGRPESLFILWSSYDE
jgi:hypothetical protein